VAEAVRPPEALREPDEEYSRSPKLLRDEDDVAPSARLEEERGAVMYERFAPEELRGAVE